MMSNKDFYYKLLDRVVEEIIGLAFNYLYDNFSLESFLLLIPIGIIVLYITIVMKIIVDLISRRFNDHPLEC